VGIKDGCRLGLEDGSLDGEKRVQSSVLRTETKKAVQKEKQMAAS
jgi:hypothetical protein